ncbi:CHAT domain-containing protein [Nocardiopsis ganjiahuensis]|uniref:CHAT domain-containing protein n=1 Tax=Nocardiopsis ganjiahuensis TaxID=239984 RepID=UPI00034A1B1A|nr:CHAT domain-containing protein [Nocardiopsis ganjiahuensis]
MLPSAAPDPTPANPLRGGESPIPEAGRALLSRVTQGVRLARRGLFEETVDLLDDTRRRLHGHPVAEVAPVLPGVLTDLGLAQTLCGRFGQAEEHLNEARSLADERGLSLLGLVARHNLGCLDLYRGDTAAAIATFHGLTHLMPADRQEPLRVDLAEALLSEGLVEEAGRTLAEAPWQTGGDRTARVLVEAKLRLLDGDHRGALHLALQVSSSAGPGSLWYGLARRLERTVRGAGRRTPVQRAKDALDLRTPAVAQPVTAPGHTGAAPSGTGYANSWDVAGARARLPRARRALDHMAGLGAPAPGPWLGDAELDPHVVRAGLESALSAGDTATALEWAELGRTWADGLVPGPVTAADTEVEQLTGRYRQALHHGAGPEAADHARRWESARWRAPRRWAGRPPAYREPVLGPLLSSLDGQAYVHYTVAGTEAVALVAVAGRVHARPLGPLLALRRTLGRFIHERSVPLPHERSTAAPGTHTKASTAPGPGHRTTTGHGRPPEALVSDALLGPVLSLVGDRPLVVTGDSYLGDLPWGVLPPLRGRPVRQVCTARSLTERPTARHGSGRVLLACGTEPREARLEVAALAGLHPGARVLERAGRKQVLAELPRSDLAHLAGHGQVGDRTPMLSRLDLHDGPLLACDLTALPTAPSLVILAACWGGRGFGGTAGRPSGFVGTLLARGAHTVVASPIPVDDALTGAAMRAFHRALAVGTDVSEAVSDHLGHIGFCCYGG